ncbi:MAG: biopolymer transporter ExbD [Candidatus Euphemobacter frigidus]|nr:biopolymer transporter ExbD [Candidatus Euphemobacter frigidus]MDP8276761.1 biopolymer transporter ExbD [Candidatus Euphemobacter frigidus]
MRRERKRSKIVINITSLIDVIFLLLIFFLVTSTFSEQPALKIDLPRATTSGSGHTEDLVLAVTRKGNLYLDQKPVARGDLLGLLAEAARRKSEPSLVLKADREVSYGLIVELMDISRRAGLEKILALTEGSADTRRGPGIEDLLRKDHEIPEETE